MSEIDSFILDCNDDVDEAFGTRQMSCNGQTFNVVWNDERQSYEGALGGMESQLQATAVAQPRHVKDPIAMLQKRCSIDGKSFRVAEVSAGSVAVTFSLAAINHTR